LSAEYMKKFIWVILFMLFVAIVTAIVLLYFAPEPEEHEYGGLFIMHFEHTEAMLC